MKNWRVEDIVSQTKQTGLGSRGYFFIKLSQTVGCLLLFVAFFLLGGTGHAVEKGELIYPMAQGDNLWNITERYLNDGFRYWNSLVKLNKITDPRHMPQGSKIRIPLRWLKIDPATVQVRDIHGTVQYSIAKQNELRPLTNSTLLKPGDKIVVGEGGNVVLEFVDQSMLFLGSGSRMTLSSIRKFSDSGLADSSLNLSSGRSESQVKTPNTRFQINTPSANTAVRGTDFRVTVDPDNAGLSHVEVLSGVVHTANNKGKRNVRAGFGTIVVKGMAPGSPVKLLPVPIISSPPNYSRELPVDIKWQAVDSAESYRIQIHRANGEQTLLIDKITPIAHFNTSALKDGDYVIRIRAIDNNGLEGHNAEKIFRLDARPRPPLAINPRTDEVVRKLLPEFEWSTPMGSTSYHFQLSEFPDLSSPLIDNRALTGTHLIPNQLKPGTYYWRMASLNDTKEGPFNTIQNFTLRPSPKSPDLSTMSSEGDENNLTLRWQAGTAGQQYKIQIAADSLFENILKEAQLKNPEFTMERSPNRVYLRVKVIDVDGFEGDWSPAQLVEPLPDPWYYVLIPAIPFLSAFLIAL